MTVIRNQPPKPRGGRPKPTTPIKVYKTSKAASPAKPAKPAAKPAKQTPADKEYSAAGLFQKELSADNSKSIQTTRGLISAANEALKQQIARQNDTLRKIATDELSRLGLNANVESINNMAGDYDFMQSMNAQTGANELAANSQLADMEKQRAAELAKLNLAFAGETKANDGFAQGDAGFGGMGGGWGGGFMPFLPFGMGGGYGDEGGYSSVMPERSETKQETLKAWNKFANKLLPKLAIGERDLSPYGLRGGLDDFGGNLDDEQATVQGRLEYYKNHPDAAPKSTGSVSRNFLSRSVFDKDRNLTSFLSATRPGHGVNTPGNTLSAAAADREYELRDSREDDDEEDDDNDGGGSRRKKKKKSRRSKSGGSKRKRRRRKSRDGGGFGGGKKKRKKRKGTTKKKKKKKKKKFKGKRPGPG